MKAARHAIALILLCFVFCTTSLFLLPAFVHASSLPETQPQESPIPIQQSDCIRYPGDLPAYSSTIRTLYYANVVQWISTSSTENDYIIAIPPGLLPGTQPVAMLGVSTQLNDKIFQPGTPLLVTATLKDPRTFEASAVKITDVSTYNICKNMAAFLNPSPQVTANGEVIYWQVEKYILSFDRTLFPADITRPVAVLVQFQNGQPMILKAGNA